MALSRSHLVGIVAAVVILLTVGNMVRTSKPVENDIDVENIGGPGGIAAKHIHEFLGPDKRVALILFDDSAASIYGKDQYVLEEHLKRYKYKTVGRKEISAGPLFSDPQSAYTGTLPMADYLQFASGHGGADAIISLVGPPMIPAEGVPEPPGVPLIIANPIGQPATLELRDSGFVAMAVLPPLENEEEDESEIMGPDPADPFAVDYRVYTPESMEY